jgi:ribose 5-phosphate isomerase A
MNKGSSLMNQDELKALVGAQALNFVKGGEFIGVGTGSTVNHFIKALGARPELVGSIKGAVSSSNVTTELLSAIGVRVVDAQQAPTLSVYIDGADEIDHSGFMIKGGGAALTREKIVASMAKQFICIADESKYVQTLGKFALPVEIIPMANAQISRQFQALGAQVKLRMKGETPLLTDNGQHILDVSGLSIKDPLAFESMVNQWPGVVTVGVFAHQKAATCLLATSAGVKSLNF